MVTVFASLRQEGCAMPHLGQSSPAAEGLGSLHLQRNKPRLTQASAEPLLESGELGS